MSFRILLFRLYNFESKCIKIFLKIGSSHFIYENLTFFEYFNVVNSKHGKQIIYWSSSSLNEKLIPIILSYFNQMHQHLKYLN
jgi:hypothetical protein